MMRRTLAACGLVLTTLAGLFVWAQQQSTASQPLARLFPGGSLLYLEARNFAGLLADWNASAEKKLWLASDNYQVFSRSRLFLKLSDAHQEFADAAGFMADLPMVQSVAGGQSALAIYDIGALEFLYVTRMEASAALNSVLLQRRSSYETRTAAGKSYYVRRGAGGRTAAFASTDGFLVLGTREDLVSNAMKLLAGQNEPALPAESWYTAAVSRSQTHGDIRMVLNMTRLLDSTYFRSYWIQRNASVLRPYTAGVVDLYREAGQLREERTLIRASEAIASGGVGQVVPWIPDDAGLVRAWADPAPESIADLVATKILSPGPTTRGELREAPASLSPDTVVGTPADLETRIDQQPLETEKKNTELEALAGVMGRVGISAALQVQRSRTAADGVYIGNETAVAILGNADWPEVTLPGAHVHRSGRVLVIASTPEILKAVTDRLGNTPSAAADASYFARYSHARELQPFTRMMEYLDAAKPRYEGGEIAPPPPFFSKNVASFGRTLGRLQSLEVTVREAAGESKQQIVYRLQ